MTTIDQLVESHREMLELENMAALAANRSLLETFSPAQLQTKGLALLKLSLTDSRTGIGNKPYVTFSKPAHSYSALPTNKFRRGEFVRIFDGSGDFSDGHLLEGVIDECTETKVVVVLNQFHHSLDESGIYGASALQALLVAWNI